MRLFSLPGALAKGGGLWLLAIFLLLPPGCSPSKAEPVTLRLGTLPMIVTLPAYVAEREALYSREGVKVELVPFRSTVERNAALLAGELDGVIAHAFDAPILNKVGGRIRVAAHARMGWPMFAVVAPSQSSLRSPADLKGVEIAVGQNTIIEYALDQLLQSRGIAPSDITKLDIQNMPLRLELLNQGKLQAAILVQPLVAAAVAAGGRVIMDDSDSPLGGVSLLFRREALEGKSQAVRRFIAAWEGAVEAINGAPTEYEALLTEVAKVPQLPTGGFRVPRFSKMGLPDARELESIVSWLSGKGLAERASYQDLVAPGYLPKGRSD